MKKLVSLLLVVVLLVCTGVSLAEGNKKLVIWSRWTENEARVDEVMKKAIERFQTDYPEYTIEVNYGGNEISKVLKTSLDAGLQIDIIDGAHDFIPNQIGPDYVANIDEYMKGTEFEASISAASAAFGKSFSPDGESWYYIPYNPFVGAIFYNKDIFAAAGIDALPATWDEFLTCCQKIRDAGYDPMTIDDAYVSLLYGHYLGLLKGQEWVGDLMTDKTGKLWSDPAVLQMAQAWEDFAARGYFAPSVGSNVFPSAQNGEFAIGTAAMYFNGSWVVNEVAEITGPDFNWGIMFMPGVPNAIYDYTVAQNGSQMFAVTKSCENPEMAVKFLSYLLSADMQQKLVDVSSAIPVVKDVTMPDKLGDLDYINNSSTYTFIWEAMPRQDSEIKPLVNDAFHQLIAGSITAEEFVTRMQTQIHE